MFWLDFLPAIWSRKFASRLIIEKSIILRGVYWHLGSITLDFFYYLRRVRRKKFGILFEQRPVFYDFA